MKKSNKDTGCHNGKNSRKYGRENAGYFKDVSARTKECDKSENKCGTEKGTASLIPSTMSPKKTKIRVRTPAIMSPAR